MDVLEPTYYEGKALWSDSFSRNQQQRKPILNLYETANKCIPQCLRNAWFVRKLSHPNTWKSQLLHEKSNTCCNTFSRETFSNRCFFSAFRLMKASILFHTANFTGDCNISIAVHDGEWISLWFFLTRKQPPCWFAQSFWNNPCYLIHICWK